MKKIKKWGRQAFINEEGKKELVHIRVAKKKYGLDKIPAGFEVHHIDMDKDNNQYHNLILIHKKDHRRIHLKKTLTIESHRSNKAD